MLGKFAEVLSPIAEKDRKTIEERIAAETTAAETTTTSTSEAPLLGSASDTPSLGSGTPSGDPGSDPLSSSSSTSSTSARILTGLGLGGGGSGGTAPIRSTTRTMPVPTKPRVGGNVYPDADYSASPPRDQKDTQFYCGGTQNSDTAVQSTTTPSDILAHRPDDFRSKQRQTESIKGGLNDALKLELPKNGKLQTPVMTWVNKIRNHLVIRGMEPVFSIAIDSDGAGNFVYEDILVKFGERTVEQITEHIERFRTGGGTPETRYDKWDYENLRLSAIVIRESIGPNLLQRISSLLPSDAPGPVVFKTALDQVMCMNATTIRTLSNQLGELSLKSIPGESVPDLTEKVTELAREIEGSGKPPSDLINLVSKPYTKGTVDAFKTYALGVHTQVMRGVFRGKWTSLVQEHNGFYQDLVQSDEYPPASGKKDDDNNIQALVAKTVDQRLQQRNGNNNNNGGNNNRNSNGGARTCYNCGDTGHIAKNCPKKKADGEKNDGGGKSDEKKEKDWRHVPPNSSKGEGKEKTVDGKVYKWCGKCRQNKGLWTVGRYLHSTEEHRSKKKDDNNNNGNNNGNEAGNLGYVDEPLDFGFLSFVGACPKGCCGDQ